MGKCNIDHSLEDVKSKLSDQKGYMPEGLVIKVDEFLNGNVTQEGLNELFHLLKKYDLASHEEKSARNQQLEQLVGGLE